MGFRQLTLALLLLVVRLSAQDAAPTMEVIGAVKVAQTLRLEVVQLRK